MFRRRWAGAAVAIALACAACGTTTHLKGAAPTDEGLGTPTPTTAPAGVAAGTGATANTSASGGASGGVLAAATTTKGAPKSSASAAVTGPIQLGFLTTAVSNASAAGFNAGQSFTDRQVYDALVTETNARGGVAGRKITPVYGTTDTASSDWAAQFQAACANLTQDHKVAAVLGYDFVFLDSFEQCLAKAGVPHLYGGYQPGDVQAQKDFPYIVSIAHPTVDLAYVTVFKGAIDSGLLTSTTKLGIMIDDCAHGLRAFDKSAAPYLSAHHISYDVVRTPCASGSTDVSSAAAAVASAELKFASEGVKLVSMNGIPLLLFTEAAQSQNYHPQYLTSAGGAAFEANAPAQQLANMHGFGWLPAVDVDAGHQPSTPTAAQQNCLAMLRRQGVQPKAYNDYFTAYVSCDAIALYGLALARTNGRTGAAEMEQALLAVMPTFQGASTYGGHLLVNASQRGGPAEYREWGWTASCTCFTYRGGISPIPSL